MSYSIATENEWEAPEINYVKSIEVYHRNEKKEDATFKQEGYEMGIMSRSIITWTKRPF